MAAKLANKSKRKHFAHIHHNPCQKCSYESYLHKLAKEKIAECFRKSEKFIISYYCRFLCDQHLSCPVKSREQCVWREKRIIDLKQYYNRCHIEKEIDDFKADLLLDHSEHTNRTPLLIEINVSHKSSDKKVNSTLRIIEIGIDNEEDIESIISHSIIEETSGYLDRFECRPNEKIKFYNFKAFYGTPPFEHQQPKFEFWIDTKKYFHFDNFEDYDGTYRCLSPCKPAVTASIFCIASKEPIEWTFAFDKLSKTIKGIRFCNMCKYYHFDSDTNKCALSKRFGLNPKPRLSDANTCQYFRIAPFIPNVNAQSMEDYGYNIWYKLP